MIFDATGASHPPNQTNHRNINATASAPTSTNGSLKTSVVVVNKDDRLLADTLQALQPLVGQALDEVVVIDASDGALDDIRQSHPWARWSDYRQPPNVRTTISHQRNIGVRLAEGDIVVFTDAGCLPQDGWLERLLEPILIEGESVTCGPAKAVGKSIYSGKRWWGNTGEVYVPVAATINLAFRREVFDAVGGFDESFAAT